MKLVRLLHSKVDSNETHLLHRLGRPDAQAVRRGVLIGLAPLALALAAAPEARAMAPISVIDNIGSTAFPGTTNDRGVTLSAWNVLSFKTPVASSAYLLKSLRLALANADGSPARNLVISLFGASNSASTINGSPAVTTSGGYRPVNQRLATTSISLTLNTSGNLGPTGDNGYTLLNDSTELGSLFDYQLLPNTDYSLVFSTDSANTIRMRSMNTAYSVLAGFVHLNNTSTTTGNGTNLSPGNITANAWITSSAVNASTFGLTIGAVQEVPGPMPVLGAAAAFGFSRRLRRRILQQP